MSMLLSMRSSAHRSVNSDRGNLSTVQQRTQIFGRCAIYIIVLVIPVSCTDAEDGLEPTATQSLEEPSTSTQDLASTTTAAGHAAVQVIGVGNNPRQVAFGSNRLWISNIGDQTVTALDAETGRVAGTVRLPGEPDDIAFANDVLWVTYNYGSSLLSIDPVNLVQMTYADSESDFGGLNVLDLDQSNGDLWGLVAGGGLSSSVYRDGTELTQIDSLASSLGFGSGAAWVSTIDGDLIRLDEHSGEFVNLLSGAVGPLAGNIVESGGLVWSRNSGVIYCIDPSTDEACLEPQVEISGVVRGLAAGFGMLWALVGSDLIRIDPTTRETVVAVEGVAEQPYYSDYENGFMELMIAAGDSIWILDSSHDTISRFTP